MRCSYLCQEHITFLLLRKQVKQVLDEILEKLPEEYNMAELMGKAEDRTPYTVVALQECDRMNTLTNEMKISLKELDLGLKVNTFKARVLQKSSSTLLTNYFLQFATF